MSELMQWNETGQIRPMTRDGAEPNGDCQPTSIRFLAGSGVTDDGGYWKLDVTAAVCEKMGPVQSVSFVATPRSAPYIDSIPEPAYIMTAWDSSGGLLLYVRTWDCNCKPKPRTLFDYHVAIAHGLAKQ